MSICLGYENSNQNDGAGAQVQRILGIYSLARRFNLGFSYIPILHIDPNPGDGMENEAERRNLVSNLNTFLLNNLGTCRHDHKIVKMRGTRFFKNRYILQSYFVLNNLLGIMKKRNVLFLIDNPWYILQTNPNFYSFCKQLDFIEEIYSVISPIQIHAHIRRGLISSTQLNERFVSTEWYSDILKSLTKELTRAKVNFSLFIHTDAKKESSSWAVSEKLSGGSLEMYQERGLINDNHAIELVGEDIEANLNLDFPVTLVTDVNPLEAWKMMNQADILLIGKSSFSFCAALMNHTSCVIAPRSTQKGDLPMPTLSEWLGDGNPDEIASECVANLRKRKPHLFI
jgi:hypothetical protein